MSVSSSTDFFPKDEDEEQRVIQRVDSSETNESPFGSNLATPVDENAFFHKGIHELLDIAETKGDYFSADEVQLGGLAKSEVIHELLDIAETKGDYFSTDEVQLGGLAKSEGIHELLDIAETKGDYFSTDEVQLGLAKSESESESMMLVASPDFSSSESIPIPKTMSIYNLPNEHILIESSSIVSKPEEEQHNEDDLLDDPGSFSTVTKMYETQNSIAGSLTVSKIIHLVIRILCFLPWCIAVGGALVLFPDHLEYLAFQTGYLTSPTGIRRFSHWAEYGMQHVVIFGTFLGLFVFVFPTTGFLLIGGLLAQFYHVWSYFSLDRSVPLGTDDLQTVYLLATTQWLNGTFLDIKKVDDDYYLLGEYEMEGRRHVDED